MYESVVSETESDNEAKPEEKEPKTDDAAKFQNETLENGTAIQASEEEPEISDPTAIEEQ